MEVGERKTTSRGRGQATHPHTTTTNTSFQTPHTHPPQTTPAGRIPISNITKAHSHYFGRNATLTRVRGVAMSLKQQSDREIRVNRRRITIVKVLHKVLYPRRTEMDSKKKGRLAG